MNTPITALRPRDADGHQFVFYSDACSGEAADPHGNARRLARLSAVARRLDPPPEFIAFPGDAVADGSRREQWRRWLEVEMAWAKDLGLTIYQSTSNHNTSSPAAYRLYREFWADLPQNGPDGQTGLAYWERRGSLLYVSLHQPDLAAEPDSSPVRGLTAVEADWLDGVLTANADAAHKFVAGHYPVFPVNGYTASPWCFAESARASLWRILRRHLLTAYLCSHVLAFDAQVHEGVLQLTSGGASGGPPDSPGVVWGPRGMMPGPVEYPHLVQLAVDAAGLRYRVHDATGTVRESLTWPFAPPSGWREGFGGWARAGADSVRLLRLAEPDDIGGLIGAGLRPYAFKDRIDWLASPDGGFRVGFEALTGRLEV
ncbi:MAG: hypothetical protein LBD70_03985, partial [Bifidobacteriaceae bacterium]|nr:hypothetical protein [Bifidobacteriaceae bacterium]